MPIYLDSNATSQVAPEVLDEMLPFFGEHYANPSSSYAAAKPVRVAIDLGRERVAEMVGAAPSEIIFTGCGTESDNAAILSALATLPDRKHIVTTAAEHSAIIEQCELLSKSDGIEVTAIAVDQHGRIDLEELRAAVRPDDTAVVSMIWGNNETGVLNPIAEAAEIAHEAGALFHTDAVQAAGKLAIDLSALEVDLLSISGHKFHAPKGIGVLYASRRVRFRPLLVGGGQEGGRRAGTENVPYIAGLGKAAQLMVEHRGDSSVRAMRDRFEKAVLAGVPGAEVNGHPTERLPTTSNLHLPGVDSGALLILLDERDIYCSAGSACHTGALNPSHVLTAMGFDRKRAGSSARFSFSRFNTPSEVERAAESVIECCQRMLEIRPLGGGPVIMAD